MKEIKTLDYVNYSRMKTIFAEDAKWLLASFELRCKNISDPSEYNKLLSEKMTFASRVICSAFNDKTLIYSCDDEPYEYNDDHEKCYFFGRIKLNLVKFCTWALKLKYDLPDELTELIKYSYSKSEKKGNTSQEKKVNPLPKTDGERNKGGKPKGVLSEAIEVVYRDLLKQGNIEVLRAGNPRVFLECLKRMTTQDYKNKNKNLSEFLLERIKEVKIPKVGKCTITTHDRESIVNSRKITTESKSYQLNEVSKILNKLRTTYPLPT